MPVVMLATYGALMLARKASDAKAKKAADRAANQGLPTVPETDPGRVNSELTDFDQHDQ